MAAALTIFDTIDQAEPIWRSAQHTAPCYLFQSFDWCRAWLETVGSRQGVTPRIVHLSLDGGNVELLLPLQLQRKRGGIVTLGFLGGRQASHAAPIIYGATPAALDGRNLWTSLKDLLRQCEADVLALRGLRASVGNVANPLLHGGHNRSSINTYSLGLSGTWADYATRRLHSKHRAESRRRWRKLARHGQVQFVVEPGGAQAQAITRWLIEHKLAQLPPDKAKLFETQRDFLLSISSEQSRDHLVRVSALILDRQLLAAHLAVVWRDSLVGIQMAYDDAWRSYGPGRLLMESLLQYAFEQQFREFDFSIGNFAYKEVYCDSSEPLYSIVRPRTALGTLYALYLKWKAT